MENQTDQTQQTQEVTTQEVIQEQVQPSEVDLLKNQLVERDREIQQRDEALYQQNIRLQTYQELFERNKSLGMSDSQASAQAQDSINGGTEPDSVEYLNTKNAVDLFNKVLTQREQEQQKVYTEQQKETYIRKTVANDAIELLKGKYDFNGNFTDEEKKVIFQDRLPKMLDLVKSGYPTTEAAFKRAFLGLIKDKGLSGLNTQSTQTSGLADTNTQITGASGNAPDVVKKMEYERAKQSMEKGEISFRDYLTKWRAVNGDTHLQPTQR